MVRLRGDHEDREVTAGLDLLQALHDLEPVQAGHLQIEQNQVVVVLAVQRADLARIHRGRDGPVARPSQYLLQQGDVGRQIIHDQDAGVENLRGTDHGAAPAATA